MQHAIRDSINLNGLETTCHLKIKKEGKICFKISSGKRFLDIDMSDESGAEIRTVIGTVMNYELTHWVGVTHISVGNLTIIVPENGLSPGWRQAIIWTNAGILLIGPCGTNFSEILIGIQTFSFKKMHLKMSSAKWRPFCLGFNELTHLIQMLPTCLDELGHYWLW